MSTYQDLWDLRVSKFKLDHPYTKKHPFWSCTLKISCETAAIEYNILRNDRKEYSQMFASVQGDHMLVKLHVKDHTTIFRILVKPNDETSLNDFRKHVCERIQHDVETSYIPWTDEKHDVILSITEEDNAMRPSKCKGYEQTCLLPGITVNASFPEIKEFQKMQRDHATEKLMNIIRDCIEHLHPQM